MALLTERLRAGDLDRERLALAGFCGDPEALVVLGWGPDRVPRAYGERPALSLPTRDTGQRFARKTLDGSEGWVEREQVETVLSRWVHCVEIVYPGASVRCSVLAGLRAWRCWTPEYVHHGGSRHWRLSCAHDVLGLAWEYLDRLTPNALDRWREAFRREPLLWLPHPVAGESRDAEDDVDRGQEISQAATISSVFARRGSWQTGMERRWPKLAAIPDDPTSRMVVYLRRRLAAWALA